MRRHALPAVVLLALGFALSGASTARVPHRLPAGALGCVLVWRVELGAVVFAGLYGVVVVARLALHGETLTRVGRDGIEIPRVGSARTGGKAPPDAAIPVSRLGQLLATIAGSATADNPTDALLRDEEECT
ncbi:MAG TPA: hypothetical protein VN635_09625 [Conexibacter sp.]|nr:hypothetical protein [Conexibacter sp.]